MHDEIMAHGATESKRVDTVDAAYPRLLKLEDIAERCAISRSMAHKLVACGQIRSLRIGRAVRVRPQDLEAYLASVIRET